jgi:hypothetical protein
MQRKVATMHPKCLLNGMDGCITSQITLAIRQVSLCLLIVLNS